MWNPGRFSFWVEWAVRSTEALLNRRVLRVTISKTAQEAVEMTNDYIVVVEERNTLIRIGRALFGR